MNIILLDTETTGFEEPKIVQLAYKNLANGEIVNELFNPEKKIDFGAMATHHIEQETVDKKPTFEGSGHKRKLQELCKNNIIVAHNAEFDVGVLKEEGVECPFFICTQKIAYHFYDLEKHSLQYIRYALDLNCDQLQKLMPHDALTDVIMLQKLWNELYVKIKIEVNSDEEKDILTRMINISRNPQMMRKIKFGKHKGMRMEQMVSVDPSYCDYLLKQEGISKDIKFTILHYRKCSNDTNSKQSSIC